ncbi:MAG: hypothetical protein ACRD96_29215, partial [Bryobacteraceae bacterium]
SIDPRRRLRGPRYQSWSAGLEQRLPGNLLARADWLRKRGAGGFTYANILDSAASPDVDAIYELANARRDEIDSASVTVRKSYANQYEWMASYTHARARSNAVVDVTIDDPIIVTTNVGPMPWDSPHRLLSWGYLPTGRKHWALAYLVEGRTGFPFSIQDDAGRLLGDVNSFRFPAVFEANLHLERKFRMTGHLWAFRFGSNNVTGRRNPTTVNNNTASSRYLTYYGGSGRTFNFRIRWLGRN